MSVSAMLLYSVVSGVFWGAARYHETHSEQAKEVEQSWTNWIAEKDVLSVKDRPTRLAFGGATISTQSYEDARVVADVNASRARATAARHDSNRRLWLLVSRGFSMYGWTLAWLMFVGCWFPSIRNEWAWVISWGLYALGFTVVVAVLAGINTWIQPIA